MSGAGAAALACAQMYVSLGAQYANFTMFDKDGVLHNNRSDLDEIRQKFSVGSSGVTLAEALQGADVFVGLSVGNILNAEMIQSMAPQARGVCHGQPHTGGYV